MRTLVNQMPIALPYVDHQHGKELIKMNELLTDIPDELWEEVQRDLVGERSAKRGRKGLSPDQVIRILVLKHLTGISYEKLAYVLLDFNGYRSFCRLEFGHKISASTLQANVKKISDVTLEKINRELMMRAQREGIEDGQKLRADTTNVESNIHPPTDSSLLADVVRVLIRLLKQARKEFGLKFSSRELTAKRRAYKLQTAKNQKQRLPLYKDMVCATENTLDEAERVAAELHQLRGLDITQGALADAITDRLHHFIELGRRIVDQTRRRVFEGEKVPNEEKLVSIFETHTDILVKGTRKVEYGHKVCFSTGASGIISDLQVLEGNPADSSLTESTVTRHKKIFGHVPRQAVFDGGFASQANLHALKEFGVEDVAFSKPCGLAIEDMVKNKRVFKKLRSFRTAIEGTISFLKRCFGMRRCLWSDFDGFKRYAWGATMSANVLLLARHLVAAN